MNIHTPWTSSKPLPLPSNLRNFTRPATPGAADGQRGIPSSEVAGVKSDGRQAVIGRATQVDHAGSHSERAVTNSPEPTVCIVRMKLNAQHIQFETLSHHSPLPATGKLAPRLKRGGPFCALVSGPLSRRNKGTIAADLQIFGAVLRALRSLSSRIHALQKPMRGLSECFYGFLRLLAHEEQTTTRGLPDERKSGARHANSTARDGKYAC